MAEKKCQHNWLYEHTIWGGHDGTNECAVHRQCGECGEHQMAVITAEAWKKADQRAYPDLPDLKSHP